MLARVQVFIRHPWLAIVITVVLFVRWRWGSRSRWTLAAAILWCAYTGWEYAVAAGPDADIRVDLLIIYPVLAVVTLAALRCELRGNRR